MNFKKGTGYCFLDAFRPGPRQRLDWAVFSTYSLDLVALVALLMELADVEGEGLDAGDVPFIHAIEKLGEKVAVLCQHGRISFPKTSAHRILILLDRFLHKMPCDERKQSWHAKIGLAKYERTDNATPGNMSGEWRLWLGSRNLTQNPDWEAGLLLVGRPAGGRGRPSEIPGLHGALGALLTRVWAEPKRVTTALAAMRGLTWHAPPGVEVEMIAFRQGDDRPALLAPPTGVRFRSITAVAPFVDLGGLSKIAGLPSIAEAERSIVTTRTQLSRQSLVERAKAEGVTLRLMALPTDDGATTLSDLPPLVDGKVPVERAPVSGDGLEGNVVAGDEGLHAKLVLARGT
ncbi:MAG: hypothetical protein ACHQPH_20745, partial [Reyranellales bacterium]